MNILVTGGAGFIGSHLARRALALGHAVTVVDNLSTGYRAQVPDAADFVYADLGNPTHYLRMRGLAPDVIFHLAAQSSGWISMDAPIRDLDDNLRATVLLTEWALSVGSPRLVFASTESVYGEGEGRAPFDEDMLPRPRSFYGCSKLACEHYLRVAHRELGLAPTSLRLFSVYGPRQDLANMRQGILSIYLSYVLRGEPVTVKGPAERVRDLVIVDDVVEAFLAAAAAPATIGRELNVCTGEAVTVGDMIRRLGRAFGRDDHPIAVEAGTPGDVFLSIGDHARMTAATGWRPTVLLDDGIRRIADAFAAARDVRRSA
ncbi:MAG: NAD-dependent epimerase/dehydratase family protein [Deltaproteobacteria bacterium]|nr:NAD-dependent epimerase/dehydratase family protein [Kofleriaceae bacterium]